MSFNKYWQRICQNISKLKPMNEQEQEFLDENMDEKLSFEQDENDKENNEKILQKTAADELAELKDRNLRLFAEFENFKN